MSSFKDFWRELKNLPVELKPGVAISPSLVYSLKNNIVTATIAPVSIGLALARSNSNQEEAEEFSKQVADHTTSDEVIFAVSDKVGEPKQNETEDEFVERATNVLKEILSKKFNV